MSIAEHLTQLHESILRLKSFLPKETTQDTTIEKMLPLALKMDINGNVKQETTSGKNLLSVPNEEKTITITGSYGAYDLYKNIQVTLEPGTYTYSYKIKSSTSGMFNKLHIMTSEYENIAVSNPYKTIGSAYEKFTGTFTLSESKKVGIIYAQTVSTATYTFTELQIEKGSTATSYEPYTNGASPNPSYPQEIETLKSWNLFDINNAQYQSSNTPIPNNNQIVANNNISWNSIYYTISGLKKNTDYCISSDLLVTSGKAYSQIFYGDKIDSSKVIKTYLNSMSTSAKYTTTFNTGDNKTITISFCTAVANSVWKLSNIQLTKGTEQKPYLPYGTIGIRRIGKNLFDFNNLINAYKENSYYKPYITIYDGYFTLVGRDNNTYFPAIWSGKANIESINKNLKPNTTYTFSFETNVDSSGNANVEIAYLDKDKNTYNTLINKSSSPITFTTGENTEIVFRLGLLNGNGSTITYRNIQLEQGTTATSYEPYQERIDYIDIQGNEVLADDIIKIDDKGNVSLVKNWGKVVLDGSENWTKGNYNNTNYFYTNDITNIKQTLNEVAVISSHYKGVKPYDMFNVDNKVYQIANYDTSSRLIIFYNIDLISDANTFKTWLSQNRPIVYYQLATPQEIDLGNINKIIPFEGTNNFEILATLEPSKIETTYYVDARTPEVSVLSLEEGSEE